MNLNVNDFLETNFIIHSKLLTLILVLVYILKSILFFSKREEFLCLDSEVDHDDRTKYSRKIELSKLFRAL